MPSKTRTGTLTNRYKKQHGLHHKHSGKYLKVYWPYIPILFFVMGGIMYSIIVLVNKPETSVATASISAPSLLDSTNKLRQLSDISSLQINPQLSTAAQIKANDMATKNYWSPVSPTGQTPWQIIQSTGYNYQSASENLAYGFSSTSSLINAWDNSPSHKQNMLNSDYNQVGFGVVNSPNFENQGPETIVVALYASTTAKPISTSSSDQPFTSASISAPHSQGITRAESLTNHDSTLTIFVTGVTVGLIGCFLILRHGFILRKWALEGEELFIKHPFLDVLLVLVLISIASLNQTVGFIS